MSERIRGKHLSPRTEFKKGQTSYNKDKKLLYLLGEKHFRWKGNDAGYGAMHEWVKRHKDKPHICECCGRKDLTGRQIHWANIDHSYRRNLDDYIALCVSCHKKFDLKIKKNPEVGSIFNLIEDNNQLSGRK